ncbi:hypothetical protein ABKN59_002630 [Abortiporus biennis]
MISLYMAMDPMRFTIQGDESSVHGVFLRKSSRKLPVLLGVHKTMPLQSRPEKDRHREFLSNLCTLDIMNTMIEFPECFELRNCFDRHVPLTTGFHRILNLWRAVQQVEQSTAGGGSRERIKYEPRCREARAMQFGHHVTEGLEGRCEYLP